MELAHGSFFGTDGVQLLRALTGGGAVARFATGSLVPPNGELPRMRMGDLLSSLGKN
jgi:hypothetical protein